MSQCPSYWCNAEYWSLTGNIWRHIWEHSWCHYLPQFCVPIAPVFHPTEWVDTQAAQASVSRLCVHQCSGCLSCTLQSSDLSGTQLQHSWDVLISAQDTLNMQLLWVLLLGFQGCQPGVRCCSCSGLPGTWKSQINGQVLSFYLKVSRCE